jgi:hypothetical protein
MAERRFVDASVTYSWTPKDWCSRLQCTVRRF